MNEDWLDWMWGGSEWVWVVVPSDETRFIDHIYIVRRLTMNRLKQERKRGQDRTEERVSDRGGKVG